ncbi:MAG: hypothetical protein PHS41_00410 [Victivallaceae bacterium]|nr:hypothetical protein [Victivallaceae bacterium]
MRISKVKRLVGVSVLGAILLAVGLPEMAPYLFPWSRMNCLSVEIDLYSGRVRHTKYYWFFPLAQRISEDRQFTRLLFPDRTRMPQPRWRDCVRFDSAHVDRSPEYPYANAIWQSGKGFEMASVRMNEVAQSALAAEIVRLWTLSGRDAEAGQYLEKLFAAQVVGCPVPGETPRMPVAQDAN